jgi:hypothetical protein
VRLYDWRARHAVFADALRRLQRLAPQRDAAFAEVLGPFDAMLRLHMAQEETVLFPLAERVELPRNGTVTVLRRDHALLRARLDRLPAGEGVGRALDLLLLGEILDHHDRREAGGLLTIEVPEAVLARFAAEEATLPPVPDPPLRPAPPPPPGPPAPLDALIHAAAHDAPLPSVPVPDHPKGPRLHARLVAAVAAASTDELVTRRDALVEVLAAARLLALLHPDPHAGAGGPE